MRVFNLFTALLLTVSCAINSAVATDYLIEFDVLAGHTPGTSATLGSEVLMPYGWRSIGSSSGARLTNQTGVTIRAIHLKTNVVGDKFVVNAASAGKLFATVWVKTDGTEAYFMDGNIPYKPGPTTGKCWMRVPPNTDLEIKTCDTTGVCPFNGQVYSQNPAEPTGQDWKKVKGLSSDMSPEWKSLMAACPSDLRNIKAYGESPDGRSIVFISSGEALAFDANTGVVSSLQLQRTEFEKVNRIVVDGNNLVKFFDSGTQIHAFNLRNTSLFEVGKKTLETK